MTEMCCSKSVDAQCNTIFALSLAYSVVRSECPNCRAVCRVKAIKLDEYWLLQCKFHFDFDGGHTIVLELNCSHCAM